MDTQSERPSPADLPELSPLGRLLTELIARSGKTRERVAKEARLNDGDLNFLLAGEESILTREACEGLASALGSTPEEIRRAGHPTVSERLASELGVPDEVLLAGQLSPLRWGPGQMQERQLQELVIAHLGTHEQRLALALSSETSIGIRLALVRSRFKDVALTAVECTQSPEVHIAALDGGDETLQLAVVAITGSDQTLLEALDRGTVRTQFAAMSRLSTVELVQVVLATRPWDAALMTAGRERIDILIGEGGSVPSRRSRGQLGAGANALEC